MFYERAKELIVNAKNTGDNINAILMEEFNMPSDKVSRTFKSLFGKTIRETLKEKFLPTREQIEDALIQSNNVNEMKELLGFSKTSVYWKGLLDREFGYSTYEKAKASYIIKHKVSQYNPTVADNVSIIMSQVLGDGSYDSLRKAIRIEHGYKQYHYLKFKVSLINKAFPETYGLDKIKHPADGYLSYSWYSGKLGTSYCTKIETWSLAKIVDSMTPLGWLLYYLDDGFLSGDPKTGQIVTGFSTINTELQALIISAMEKYGIKGWNTNYGDVRLSSKVAVASFLNNIIAPFSDIIPECMEYKCTMKI